MAQEFYLPDIRPSWACNDWWQRSADSLFAKLATMGYAIVQLPRQGTQTSGLSAAHGELFARDGLFEKSIDEKLRIRVYNSESDCGYKDLGPKQCITYRSGPWVPDGLSAAQHAAFHNVSCSLA